MATIARERVAMAQQESWELPPQRPWLARALRPWLENPAGFIGLFVVIAFVVLGIIGPLIAPYDPRAIDIGAQYASPSWEHPFGGTKLGQDIFSRILDGARLSLTFGIAVMIFGFIPGTVLGIASGYFGRWVDYAIQRSGEAWAAIPQLPVLFIVIAAIGPGLKAVVIVIGIGALFGGSRLLRVVALVEKHKEYVFAARSVGATEWDILRRYIVPNVMPFVLVGLSSVFAVAIIAEATLSFLGLGAETGTPGWGGDLASNQRDAIQRPMLVLWPGLAISIVVLGFNLLGDTLRDILDPRLRGSTGPKK
ncbi:MAG TPA: ABC transporter permease [Dehalococcoidia bacterium]|nr:ABC transporter permease [Dehalococcoidia bacterium]